MLRIIIDLDSTYSDPSHEDRVTINTIDHPEYLEYLKSGLPATFCDCDIEFDFECDGVIVFDEKYQNWFGVLDWPTMRHLPRRPQDN
jgi:hypothetical protein